MRSVLGLGASALAGIAAIISNQDGDADLVPFFVGLTFLGGMFAWAAGSEDDRMRRRVARAIQLIWGLAAIWIALLLAFAQASSTTSSPTPTPPATYLGLPATVYHLLALYGGLVLLVLADLPVMRTGRNQSEVATPVD